MASLIATSFVCCGLLRRINTALLINKCAELNVSHLPRPRADDEPTRWLTERTFTSQRHSWSELNWSELAGISQFWARWELHVVQISWFLSRRSVNGPLHSVLTPSRILSVDPIGWENRNYIIPLANAGQALILKTEFKTAGGLKPIRLFDFCVGTSP